MKGTPSPSPLTHIHLLTMETALPEHLYTSPEVCLQLKRSVKHLYRIVRKAFF